MKRLFDIFVSVTVLLAFSPFLLILAAAILLDSGPPIFFVQERLGRSLRPFRMWKFRKMKWNNEGPGLTVGGDVRITRVGRWLRLSKLDELPQFVNVLRGDMSIVGPRPEIAAYAMLYEQRFRRILTLRPGITDPASVAFRHEEEILACSDNPLQAYAEVILPAKLDLAEAYLENHTLRTDLKVILQTFFAVVRSSGADSQGCSAAKES